VQPLTSWDAPLTAITQFGGAERTVRKYSGRQTFRWFQEMERRGIDPWTGDIPAEFQDDHWLHSPD
jgi:hypothetical protein